MSRARKNAKYAIIVDAGNVQTAGLIHVAAVAFKPTNQEWKMKEKQRRELINMGVKPESWDSAAIVAACIAVGFLLGWIALFLAFLEHYYK